MHDQGILRVGGHRNDVGWTGRTRGMEWSGHGSQGVSWIGHVAAKLSRTTCAASGSVAKLNSAVGVVLPWPASQRPFVSDLPVTCQ